MDDLSTQIAFERAERQLESVTGVSPVLLATDRHPGYRSGRWAVRNAGGRPLVRVQHHHAHIASALAEHGLDGGERVIGVAFDGTGYGDDGAVWGGEVLLADYAGYTRFAHLAYVPLPGGDAAVRRPYRMALSHLRAAGIPWDPDLPCTSSCPEDELRLLSRQLERDLNCAATSSMGRLFDSVSSLAGICQLSGYEAQAAMELESAALRATGHADRHPYAFALNHPAPGRDGPVTADPAPLLASVVADLRAGADTSVIAARFHAAVTGLVAELCVLARERHALDVVALTGGVFANGLLSSSCARVLSGLGFTVLRHRQVPPNDGGLALGQLMVAAARGATDPHSEERSMCLAVPGRVLDIAEKDGTRMATVDFGGVQKEVCLEYLPDLQVGEYAIVHVGFALQRLDEESARQTLALFAELGMLQEEFGDPWELAADAADGGEGGPR